MPKSQLTADGVELLNGRIVVFFCNTYANGFPTEFIIFDENTKTNYQRWEVCLAKRKIGNVREFGSYG